MATENANGHLRIRFEASGSGTNWYNDREYAS